MSGSSIFFRRPGFRRSCNRPLRLGFRAAPDVGRRLVSSAEEKVLVGSVIKKRRKRMAKKKHRKLLKKTRIQRRRQGK